MARLPLRPLEKLLSMQEAADTLGVTKKTVLAHIRDGRLAYIDIGTGGVRQCRKFRPSDLAAFMDAQRTQCVPVEQRIQTRKRRRTSALALRSESMGIRALLASPESKRIKR